MIKNTFFDLALQQASALLGKKRRMLLLLAKLGMKLKDVQWNQIRDNDVKGRFLAITRLFKAYVFGRYTTIPWKSLVLITATIIYFISPLDLVPDFLLGVGFTDDFAILLMVYNSIHQELEKFLAWERSQALDV